MTLSSLLIQLLNGLATASSLFLVAAGLSLIFGVTRIVNFAHGSLYMLGLYIAYTLIGKLGMGAFGFWTGILLAAVCTGLIGIVIEVTLLRRIYRAPELFQLLATFALVLVIKDIALFAWGSEDLLGPRAPGLGGSVTILERRFPEYDLLLIAVGPLVLLALHLLLAKTRFGRMVRAATQDREMVGALGVNQKMLFTAVFGLGSLLAGLGGALQIPREPATLMLDLQALGDAFVIVVIGGMGSIPGAYLAALIVAEVKAVCIALGTITVFGIPIAMSKLTLVAEFLVMALVLIFRPWGLLGRPTGTARSVAPPEAPLRAAPAMLRNLSWVVLAALVALAFVGKQAPYAIVLMTDILIAVLFAVSLHFIMGPAGLHSFGHAAYYGVGAYGAALLMKAGGLPMEIAFLGAPVLAIVAALAFGWFSVRLSGVYFAMLTLAFAQIVWSIVFQWDEITGGSNGITGVWPSKWFADKTTYFLLALAVCAIGVYVLRRMLFAPFGFAMRAGRDSPLRSEAIGIDVKRVQWIAFVIAAVFAGYAGALFAFSKGSISPETIAFGRSMDGLIMVLLGGIQTITGPVVGAVAFTWLQDFTVRSTEYWRAFMGLTILALVLAFPEGIVGFVQKRFMKAPT